MSLLAITGGQAILFGIGAGLAVLVLGWVVAASFRRPRRTPELDIPAGMKPGPSDADLEEPIRSKSYFWVMVLFLFAAVWLAVYWYIEPNTNLTDQRNLDALSVARGAETIEVGSEENPLGFNCVRCHGEGLTGGQNVYNGKIVPVPDLTTVCGGAEYGHGLIRGLDDVIQTIAAGRPGTDMPSWSVRFAGAMDDQQIEDVVNYILSIQKVPDDKNICINPPEATEA